MRKLKLIITFYQSYALASWIITLSCMKFAYTYGFQTVTLLFWFKMITGAVMIFYINSYKHDEFYYYKNLGTSRLQLWTSTLSFDLIMFVSLLILALELR